MKRKTFELIKYFLAAAILAAIIFGVVYWWSARPQVISPAGATVKLYYYNRYADRLEPVERSLPDRRAPINSTLDLLINGGLTAAERAAGFVSEFPQPRFKLLAVSLQGGVLTLRFTEVPGFTTGGSARIIMLINQIEQTAKQFPEVKAVKFKPDSLFQP